ncbi:hypothetical protein EAH89_20125 [Roseomonas nepalensis]|uniref:Uncharacterized protein n=1 Tax=Muricoccus nepalensis TaxID=1854500 RepID=A0A502FQ49_9PROT|nr:hypothetical protein [Roseomonas nepalensis]TPG51550.1 hypothetical protein EAH89_20125 [Roseomonas nepalensis]
MTLRPKPPRSGPARPGGEPADPFDLWLRRSVHKAYDAVLDEQVPEDLLRLCSDNRTEWVAMKDRWLGLGAEERGPLGGPGAGGGDPPGDGPKGDGFGGDGSTGEGGEDGGGAGRR